MVKGVEGCESQIKEAARSPRTVKERKSEWKKKTRSRNGEGKDAGMEVRKHEERNEDRKDKGISNHRWMD